MDKFGLAALAGSRSGSVTPGSDVTPEDIFSIDLYEGLGTLNTIENGIDYISKDALVLIKSTENQNYKFQSFDTQSGNGKLLELSSDATQQTVDAVTFGSGSLNLTGGTNTNINGNSYVAYSFVKNTKFFDIIKYTGNGSPDRSISHGLGVLPGMVVVKSLTSVGNFDVWHKDRSVSTLAGKLNTQDIFNSTSYSDKFGTTSFDSSTFRVGANNNVSGQQYIAYLFAHDTGEAGNIQCGSYTGDGTVAGPLANLGWEPQFILIKDTSNSSPWFFFDYIRGISNKLNQISSASVVEHDNVLTNPDQTAGVNVISSNFISLSERGFSPNSTSALNISGHEYIYLAVRRPNKIPLFGTEVFSASNFIGNGLINDELTLPFIPDLLMFFKRSGSTARNGYVVDRFNGFKAALTTSLNASIEAFNSASQSSKNKKTISFTTSTGVNTDTESFSFHAFKRAPKFFDVVYYEGTGILRDINHNLKAIPELILYKSKTFDDNWVVYHKSVGASNYLSLNSAALPSDSGTIWSVPPSLTTFKAGTHTYVNRDNEFFTAYLFASLQGVSKIGSFTGNGGSQIVNCDFSTGARFILIKRISGAVGDWILWDSGRGIVTGNDPALKINVASNQPEIFITNDSIDPHSSGFIINQNTLTNINVSGSDYIFFAIS